MSFKFNPLSGKFDIVSTTGGGGGVTSINGVTGAITLVAGTNITITPSGSNITIASTGATDAFTIIQTDHGTFPTALSPTSTLTLTSTDLVITGNSGSNSVTYGLATVNTSPGTYTYATLTVNGKGLVTSASNGVTPLTTTLPSGDIFVGNGSNVATATALSGDALLSNTGVLTLDTVNANVGSFGSSTSIPSFTVNAKGLITAASGNVVIAPAATLTGTTLASNVVSSSLTSIGTITSGTWNGTTIGVPYGGTGLSTTPTNGQLLIGSTSGSNYVLNTLTAGTGISITNASGSITVTNTSPSSGGTVTSVAQTTNTISGLTISGSPITTNGTLALTLAQATTSTNGYLSSTDWNTFNNKQVAGNYITALTGDVTASGPGSVTATLATVNSTTGSFGSSTAIPSFTVNGKGLITLAGTNVVIAPAGTLSGTTLNSTVISSSLTSVGTITSGVWNGTTISIANGGTGQTTVSAAFNALSPLTTAGDLLYYNGTTNTRLPIGTVGQVLTVFGGEPSWQSSNIVTVVTKSANYTLLISDSSTYFNINTSGGALTLTLPAPSSGLFYKIKDSTGSFGTNNCTLAPHSTEMIDGLAANKVLQTNWGDFQVYSDGTNWFMTNG
jgi:hypothetical protein